MRCREHNQESAQTCANCGNVLCEDCKRYKVNGKIACSKEYRARIVRADTLKLMGLDQPKSKRKR